MGLPDPAASPVSIVAGGARVRLKVAPRAARNRVEGLAPEADGGVALKVSVTAAPEDGKANAAVVKLLAAEWDVPRSTVEVVLGAADRRKVVQVSGEPARLARMLTDWLARRLGADGRGIDRRGQE